MGEMGRLYAHTFKRAGYAVCGTDVASRLKELEQMLKGSGIELLADGHAVARCSDLIIYAVEAERIGTVVKQYAASTKYGAVVCGQTSVKTPEIQAFEAYLPPEVPIVLCHSLHGPAFSTEGQNLILICHRADKQAYSKVKGIFNAFKSNIIEIADYRVHDQIMADTQAITHMGFESMGSAWKNAGFYPWDHPAYAAGIDNVKILITLRIFGYPSHVYAGLAILNPFARKQVRGYAQAVRELFRLMICENEKEFRRKIYEARDFVFRDEGKSLLFDEEIMTAFSLATPGRQYKANSHLSLLSMVYAWEQMKINPYDQLLCQTPPFRLRLGITEYLFRNEALLEETIRTALHDRSIRADDLEFHTAVHEWASLIAHGDMEGYKTQFEEAQSFFRERLPEGLRMSAEMIRRLGKSE